MKPIENVTIPYEEYRLLYSIRDAAENFVYDGATNTELESELTKFWIYIRNRFPEYYMEIDNDG